MSDLHEVDQKVKEGAEWRGTINVTIDGDDHELTIRQLVDPEYEEVMKLIDRDELQEYRDQLPEDVLEEYQELSDADELSDEESERLAELEEQLDDADVDIFEVLSTDTFEGIRQTAKYCVEPDEEDRQHAFRERAHEIEDEYGIKVQTPDDVEQALQDDIEAMIDRCTDFTSFAIGIRCLVETVGDDEGN